MSDYQRVVEFLRDFRAAAVQTVTDEVRAAAADYAELCASANERLRQCAVLLQRGLRAEAINLADASPNLLDLVAALDLPAPEQWIEFCQRSELPAPQALQIERAAQLNDAYGQDQPLEQLFAQHRRLALSQASVYKRLAVMRQIAQLDPSPFWEKDIRDFEHARFKQLRINFAAAVRDKDLKTITSLSREVMESSWIEAVPSDLQSAARDVQDRVRLVQFDASLQELLTRLRPAFAARSLDECSALLGEIRALMASYGRSSLTGDAAPQVESAEAWVREEERLKAQREAFISACDALTGALDGDASDAELERTHRSVAALGEPPGELQQRYERTMRRRAVAGRRKFLLGLAAAAAVVLIALGVGYSIYQSSQARYWAVEIDRAVNSRKLETVSKIIKAQEQRSPRSSDSPLVAAAKRRAATLQQQADGDAATLRDALALLGAAAHKADAARVADDASTTGTAALDQLRAADGAIDDALARRKQLPNLAWVDPNNALQVATAQLVAMRQDLKQRVTRGAQARAQTIADKADAVALDPAGTMPRAADLEKADAALTALETELSPLHGYAGADAAVDAASKKIADRRDVLRHERDMLDARRQLASKSGDEASAREALEAFARQFPDSPLSRDFAKAAAATGFYKSIETWRQVSGPWATEPAPSSETVAQKRLDLARGFLHDYPASPEASRASAYADYLQQAVDALAVQNTWQTAMSNSLTSPLISDLKYMETSDGARYYVLKETALHRQELNDRITFSFDAMDPQNLTRTKPISVNPPRTLLTPKPVPVPHAVFAQTIGEELKTVDPGNWDVFGINLSAQIASADKIDPVVKGILLRDALIATSKADGWALGDLYQKPADDLVRQALDQVVWWDPEHPTPAVTITNLNRIFAEIPKAPDARQKVADKRAELFRSLRPQFAGIGLLLRDEQGKWTVESAVAPQPGASAMVVVPAAGESPAAAPAPVTAPTTAPATPAGADASAAPAGAPATPSTLLRLGDYKAGGWVIDAATASQFPQGTMVLLTRAGGS